MGVAGTTTACAHQRSDRNREALFHRRERQVCQWCAGPASRGLAESQLATSRTGGSRRRTRRPGAGDRGRGASRRSGFRRSEPPQAVRLDAAQRARTDPGISRFEFARSSRRPWRRRRWRRRCGADPGGSFARCGRRGTHRRRFRRRKPGPRAS